MRKIWMGAMILAALAISAGGAVAATPTRLTITAPPTAGMGEDITVEARLSAADGQLLAGATLDLFQVGAVGERVLARVTTDEKGEASFVHNEFTVAHLALRVRFAGDAQHGPAMAQAHLEIFGIEVLPAVVMAHTPSPLVKGVLFSLLGAVWLTYAFAGLCVLRIVRTVTAGR